MTLQKIKILGFFLLSILNTFSISAPGFATVYKVECRTRVFDEDGESISPLMEHSSLSSYWATEEDVVIQIKARRFRDLHEQKPTLRYFDASQHELGQLVLRLTLNERQLTNQMQFFHSIDDHFSSTSTPLNAGVGVVGSASLGTGVHKLSYRIQCRREDSVKALSTAPEGKSIRSYGGGQAKIVFDSLSPESEILVNPDLSLPDIDYRGHSRIYYRESDDHWCEKYLAPGTPRADDPSVDLHTYIGACLRLEMAKPASC